MPSVKAIAAAERQTVDGSWKKMSKNNWVVWTGIERRAALARGPSQAMRWRLMSCQVNWHANAYAHLWMKCMWRWQQLCTLISIDLGYVHKIIYPCAWQSAGFISNDHQYCHAYHVCIRKKRFTKEFGSCKILKDFVLLSRLIKRLRRWLK